MTPEELVREHRGFLWGLSYRMTGSAADADDVVQETFERAIAHPPADTERPWRPWLTRVAINLARDRLRARKREVYDGPWLPSPIDTQRAPDEDAPDARYGRIESLTVAFLVALEALRPKERAVLLLRDVYDYSVRETAEHLSLSEGNVKVIHHRARAAMASYDAAPARPTEEAKQRVLLALARVTDALARRDADALVAALTPDARTLNDAGGEFHAARNVVVGADRVARFYLGLAEKTIGAVHTEIVELNGYPALFASLESPLSGQAPRFVVQADVADDGRVRELRAILATAKLSALISS